MANEHAGSLLHSAEYFGDTRDHWWNSDSLELMARRANLGSVRRALDVGCGVGHWGRLLLPRLHEEAQLVGVDREAAWVAAATARAKAQQLEARLQYQVARAEQLPFANDSFDMVTCQTVLMHVKSAEVALREMLRVTKPGGTVLVAEPNNSASAFIFDSATKQAPVEELLARARLLLTCHRGKAALGEGDSDVGDRLPSLFASLGLEQVTAWLNDKASVVMPPYEGAMAQAHLDEVRDFAARDFFWWSRADTLRFFLAGGGDAQRFEQLWAPSVGLSARAVVDLDAGTYWSTNLGVFYVVVGRKPA